MSAIIADHIATWRHNQPRFNPSGLRAWHVGSLQAGWLQPTIAQRLIDAALLRESEQGLVLHTRLINPSQRSVAMQQFATSLRDAGLIAGWRNENYDWIDAAGTVQLRMERAAFRPLGLRSRAVHVNGYRADGSLWIARRAETKATDPGKLDNVAAGGIASGETPIQALVRELAEEAGVPSSIANKAKPQGVIHSLRNEPDGVHDETLHCFDLLLPNDFTPHNTDGEVTEFTLLTAEQAASQLQGMTWDAAAVTVAWLQRQMAN